MDTEDETMIRRTALTLLALSPLLLAAASLREDPKPEGLERLRWMAGHWAHEEKGVAAEEAWLAPRAGLMLGLHRDVHVGREKLLSFEYLRIEERDDTLVYVATPGGGESTEFTLESAEEHSVLFTNPEHDFPKRIRYWRTDDELHARVEGDGDRALEWTWKLQP